MKDQEITFPPTRDVDPESFRKAMDKALWEATHCKCGANLPRRSYNYNIHQCYKCEQEEKVKKKSDWMDEQKELTIEERLVNIEEFMYWYRNTDHRDPRTIPMR